LLEKGTTARGEGPRKRRNEPVLENLWKKTNLWAETDEKSGEARLKG